MKKTLMSLLLASLCFSTFAYAVIDGERFLQSEEAVKNALYGHIDAKGLKALMESQTPFVLLDARGHKWHDENIIPGAQLASYEDSTQELESIIPDKNALVVVYCFTFTCPLSTRLAHRLVELGYANIVEYPAGLKEWRDIAEYPVDIIQAYHLKKAEVEKRKSEIKGSVFNSPYFTAFRLSLCPFVE